MTGCRLTILYGLLPQDKRLIFLLVRGEASSRISGICSGLRRIRADMGSGTSKRQSVGAAVELPELLSALIEAVATFGAMMGDQSRGLRRWDWWKPVVLGGGRELVFAPGSRTRSLVRHLVAQHRITNAGEFVGERANGFVGMGSRLYAERPGAQRI